MQEKKNDFHRSCHTEDMGFEPTHAVTRLPRFQHGLLSLLSNLPYMELVGVFKAFWEQLLRELFPHFGYHSTIIVTHSH